MNRKAVSAEQIQREVDARLNSIQEVIEDKARINVPLPQWNEPNATGSNWHMSVFGGDARGYTDAIARVVAEVQAIYNLAE